MRGRKDEWTRGREDERTKGREGGISFPVFIYTILLTYLGIVVYPMIWLLYTSLKTDREIWDQAPVVAE